MPIICQRADIPNSIIYLLNSAETKTKANLAEILAVICVSSPIGLQNVVSFLYLYSLLLSFFGPLSFIYLFTLSYFNDEFDYVEAEVVPAVQGADERREAVCYSRQVSFYPTLRRRILGMIPPNHFFFLFLLFFLLFFFLLSSFEIG